MKTIINIKADKEVKDQAVATAREMGVPLSVVVNSFLKKFIADKSFTLTASLTPSKKLAKVLKQAQKDIRNGANMSPLFTDMEKMDRYLAGI
jgi:addiction module RelB/DinJ family antitoxin